MVGYEGAEYGFFNPPNADGKWYRQTALEMDRFLASIGYLSNVRHQVMLSGRNEDPSPTWVSKIRYQRGKGSDVTRRHVRLPLLPFVDRDVVHLLPAGIDPLGRDRPGLPIARHRRRLCRGHLSSFLRNSLHSRRIDARARDISVSGLFPVTGLSFPS